ncbi:MAG: S-ribosylhomocysteine lyase [Clostridiales bacterium]|nr:S-ribosylhomocysteine lyase [Clostridiales bacterium]
MNKIKSFQVDHRRLDEGIYISRIDGDCVTYDLRFCRPNTGILLDNSSIHTTEHMLATYLRNSDIAKEVVYFGPMGCQTGFYLIVRDSVSPERVLESVKDALRLTMEYEGEVFGKSELECGNYINLDLAKAKRACGAYLSRLEQTDRIVPYEEL